jgi:catechol 2,3-dioxygenase-like lactoylglutathione lyase family enzyme
MTAAPESTAKLHVSLNVADVNRSAQFYEAFLGQPAHKRRPGYANFDIAYPPLKLALNEIAPQPGVGRLNHLGIVVPSREDVEAARQRLIDAGLATFDERDVDCCYAIQDKVWATDPDGNQWEVYVLLDDLLDDDHDHRESTTCCTPEQSCGETAGPCCTGTGPMPITFAA